MTEFSVNPFNPFSWIVYIRNMSAFLSSCVKAGMGIDVDDFFLSFSYHLSFWLSIPLQSSSVQC